MEIVDEIEGASAAIELGGTAEVAEKDHKVVIAAHADVGDVVVLASRGKPLSFGHTHQEASEPPAKAAAQNQQGLAIEFIEKARWATGFGLERVEELDEVFLSHGVCGRGRQLSHQVENERRISIRQIARTLQVLRQVL